MAYMKVLDGDGNAYYIKVEGAGTTGDPAKLSRILEGGYRLKKAEITRPANTTPYSANDCVADNAPSTTTHRVQNCGRVVGGTGAIVKAALYTNNLSWTQALTAVIYQGDGPAAYIADNSAFDPMYADLADVVCQISFPSFNKVTGGAGSYAWAIVDGLNKPFECGAAVDDLYFQLYQAGTPTPASGQKFQLALGIIQD